MNRLEASAESHLTGQSFVVPQNAGHIVTWMGQNGSFSQKIIHLFSEKTRERLAALCQKEPAKRGVVQILKNGEAILQDCCDVYGGKKLKAERVFESRRRFNEMVDAFRKAPLLECLDLSELEQIKGALSNLETELERCVISFLQLLNKHPDKTAALLDYLKEVTGFENGEGFQFLLSTEIEREIDRRTPITQKEKSLSTQFFEAGANHLNKLSLMFAMALSISGMWITYQKYRV